LDWKLTMYMNYSHRDTVELNPSMSPLHCRLRHTIPCGLLVDDRLKKWSMIGRRRDWRYASLLSALASAPSELWKQWCPRTSRVVVTCKPRSSETVVSSWGPQFNVDLVEVGSGLLSCLDVTVRIRNHSNNQRPAWQ
jgi:hypothetical protein